ncbi:MAG TPA: hypothetical protein VFU47_04965 [Armatimonadota bacterium]|nr:hypothetical protein [Armatimonadota bacterium]
MHTERLQEEDPVLGSVITEDWGRMADDEGLEGTVAEVPQTGEPAAPPPPPDLPTPDPSPPDRP